MLMSKLFTVSLICSRRDWFKVNRDYQREEDVWSLQDKQYLIDTIIKDLDLPKFYLRRLGEKDYEIVDGQQRMLTIWQFRDGKFSLDANISGLKPGELKYENLPAKYTENFENFNLYCVILDGYDDDNVRELFSRLQRGKPLNPAEKLNACPGSIVPTMRKLSSIFLEKKVSFGLGRYKAYHIVARFMLLESQGITDVSPTYLYEFFDKNRKMTEESDVAKRVSKVLHYLDEVFLDKTPELSNDSWLINLYLLVSDLMGKYSIKDRKSDIGEFYKKFWYVIESSRKTGVGDSSIMKFVEANSAGTTSQANITVRFNIIKQQFIEAYRDLELLDPQRSFDHFEKTVIYRRDKGICQLCGNTVTWDNYHGDHVKAHVHAGPTTIENGQVLCSACNLKKSSKLTDN